MEFDVTIIGSGPGGYVAAIRAAQLGLKTAVVEKSPTFGGTCLNVGCIPSKALLDSSEKYFLAKHDFENHGINFSSLKLNLSQMMKRKTQVVSELTQGISYLFKKNKITSFQGIGSVLGAHEVQVKMSNGDLKNIKSKNIILATGSEPIELPFLKFNEKNVLSSTGALALDKVPKTMTIIGAGVIGLELGSVWNRLGAEVTVLEFADGICGNMDKELTKKLKVSLEKQGLKFILNAKVEKAKVTNKNITLEYEKDGATHSLTSDTVLVAVGRRPYSDNLNVATDEKGFVIVNKNFQTNTPSVYAIGDLIGGSLLAHKAEEEGVAVAEMIAKQGGHVNYNTLPNVVYTWPELASVGKTEEEIQSPYSVGKFSFSANGRAKASGFTEGLVKVLADKTTDKILGVHILGPHASELIGEAVAVMEFEGSAEDLARSFHAHPTLSEALREAALGVAKRTRQF